MGIIAEYLGRVFQEVKERPSFVILEELDHTNASNRARSKSK